MYVHIHNIPVYLRARGRLCAEWGVDVILARLVDGRADDQLGPML
jgi:hypothetical protein